jgi:hypothetical protein
MDTQEDKPLSDAEVRRLTILALLLYMGACVLFFFPVGFLGSLCDRTYGSLPLKWIFAVILLFDIVWGILMRKMWPIKSSRRKAYISVLVYAVSAGILSDFYVIAFFKGAFE